jgi:hypothetical protein
MKTILEYAAQLIESHYVGMERITDKLREYDKKIITVLPTEEIIIRRVANGGCYYKGRPYVVKNQTITL